MKDTINEMKNTTESFINRLNQAEERIFKLENRSLNIDQNRSLRREKRNKNEKE